VLLDDRVSVRWVVCGEHVDPQVVHFPVKVIVFLIEVFGSSQIDPHAYNLALGVQLLY
jgi:hypothetical protein